MARFLSGRHYKMRLTMSKFETVKHLPLDETQSSAVALMMSLQSQLENLPRAIQQIESLPAAAAELADAIVPLAQALPEILRLLESMDHRLKAIELALPRNDKKQILILPAAHDLVEMRESLRDRGMLSKLLNP